MPGKHRLLLDRRVEAEPERRVPCHRSRPCHRRTTNLSAYGTSEIRNAINDSDHTAVIKPPPLKPAVPGALTLDNFTIDELAGTATCPAGITRPITPSHSITFGIACRDCPLRTRCITKKDRPDAAGCRHTMPCSAKPATTGPHDPSLREGYGKHRLQVERGIAQMATRGGRHLKLRYAASPRTTPGCTTASPRSNLRRLISLGLGHDGLATAPHDPTERANTHARRRHHRKPSRNRLAHSDPTPSPDHPLFRGLLGAQECEDGEHPTVELVVGW